jgi:hypothetical protein
MRTQDAVAVQASHGYVRGVLGREFRCERGGIRLLIGPEGPQRACGLELLGYQFPWVFPEPRPSSFILHPSSFILHPSCFHRVKRFPQDLPDTNALRGDKCIRLVPTRTMVSCNLLTVEESSACAIRCRILRRIWQEACRRQDKSFNYQARNAAEETVFYWC